MLVFTFKQVHFFPAQSCCSDGAKVTAPPSAAHTRVSVSVFVSEAALRHANSQHWQPSLFACDLDWPVGLSHGFKGAVTQQEGKRGRRGLGGSGREGMLVTVTSSQ